MCMYSSHEHMLWYLYLYMLLEKKWINLQRTEPVPYTHEPNPIKSLHDSWLGTVTGIPPRLMGFVGRRTCIRERDEVSSKQYLCYLLFFIYHCRWCFCRLLLFHIGGYPWYLSPLLLFLFFCLFVWLLFLQVIPGSEPLSRIINGLVLFLIVWLLIVVTEILGCCKYVLFCFVGNCWWLSTTAIELRTVFVKQYWQFNW